MDSKEHIKNIHVEHDGSAERTLLALSKAIHRIQQTFPRYGSFLLEFIQNADDEKSSLIRVELRKDSVKVINNGESFNRNDVESICSVGLSFKSIEENIGYLGVGFKSVFLISDSPSIHSGGYHFKFDISFWRNPKSTPWQIIPIWLEAPEPKIDDEKTTFIIPFKSDSAYKLIRDELKDTALNNRVLLFLQHIEEIELANFVSRTTRKLKKKKVEENKDYTIYSIKEFRNKKLHNETRWLLFSRTGDVPVHVRNDEATITWERQDVKKRRLAVAFRLNDDNELQLEKSGTAHIGVFSFRHLKEVPSGLNFIIQGDFLTGVGRGDIPQQYLWNRWISEEITRLLVDQCIPAFLQDIRWKMNFTTILYSSSVGDALLDETIKDPLNTYLMKNDVLIDEDNAPCPVRDAIAIKVSIRDFFSPDDLAAMFPKKRILHRNCTPHPELEYSNYGPSEVGNMARYKNEALYRLLRLRARQKNLDWFLRLYSFLAENYTLQYFRQHYSQFNVQHDDFWDGVADSNIILTNRYQLCKPSESFIRPIGTSIPKDISGSVSIVHPKIASSKLFQQFCHALNTQQHSRRYPDNVKTIDKEMIRQMIEKKCTKELTENKWKYLSQKEKVRQAAKIKALWDEHHIDLERYHFITLKSKSGKWLEPKGLLFPTEYNPEYQIELLIGEQLLDYDFEFVHPEYLANSFNPYKWRQFLGKLGVDSKLADENYRKELVERVGIIVSMKYELNQGRHPKELGMSQKKKGDIESVVDKYSRRIEAKGRSDDKWDIQLDETQTGNVFENPKEYYLYIVTEALNNPTLRIVSGSRLVDMGKLRIKVPFSTWCTDENVEAVYTPLLGAK